MDIETATPSQIACFHAVVSGRVQGVGFRYRTMEKAISLGLEGYVRNLPDGSVEVLAQGPREPLEQLLAWLRKGPPMAHVSNMAVSWHAPNPAWTDFEVRF